MTIPGRFAVIDVSHWHAVHDAAYCTLLHEMGATIAGVSDRNPALAARRAEQFGAQAFTDYREMLAAVRPAFVIALGRHTDMPATFRHLVENGLPFIMEKPWGTDPDTVAALADLVRQRGTWASVPFINRTSFWATTARRLIAEGAFGPISHIVYRTIRPTPQRYVEWDSPWMADPAVAGGGALMNLGGHGFDMAWFLTGEEPAVLSAALSHAAHRGAVEDYALVTLRTPSGILFHNEVGYTMPTWPANQTDAEQKVAGARLLLRAVPAGLHLRGPQRDEMIPLPPDTRGGYATWLRATLEAWGRGDPPPIGATDALRVSRLTHAAYRAAQRIAPAA
jgi:predicted dehydrogenase